MCQARSPRPEILDGLDAFLAKSFGPNLLPYLYAPGGGVENMGMARAVCDMLLTTRYNVLGQPLVLFGAWPATEPASFTGLVAKGGFKVTAAFKPEAGVGPVQVVASVGGPCTMVLPRGWSASHVKGVCGGKAVPITVDQDVVSFDSPAGVECVLSG